LTFLGFRFNGIGVVEPAIVDSQAAHAGGLAGMLYVADTHTRFATRSPDRRLTTE
jgi:hypothetical protein